MPYPEKLWFDCSVLSIGFGCHFQRNDGLISVSRLLALAAIAIEMMVWL
jgi:hypothetical protein